MNHKEALDTFVSLSRFFGAFSHFTQGAGGNISVKVEESIFIKSSGVFLNEVSPTHGYVECDLFQLHQKKYTCVEETIKSGSGKPSMELGFHLLPTKFVVHFHPSFLLPLLCKPMSSIEEVVVKYNMHSMIVPYRQPGPELSDYIIYHYTNQKIIFLQNHGVILLGNTIDEIFKQLDSVLGIAVDITPTLLPELYEATSHTLFKIIHDTGLFVQYITSTDTLPNTFPILTPDFFLFLKEAPFICSQYEPERLTLYKEKYGYLPAIVQIDNIVVCLSSSWKQTYALKEIFQAWYPVAKEKLKVIPRSEAYALYDSKQEQYRLELKN